MSEREAVRALEPKGLQLGKRWRLHVHGWKQWSEWLGGDWGWRNFALIEVAYEHGVYKGRYHELQLGLLGLCVEIELYDAVDRAGELSVVERRMQNFLQDRKAPEDGGKEEWQQ